MYYLSYLALFLRRFIIWIAYIFTYGFVFFAPVLILQDLIQTDINENFGVILGLWLIIFLEVHFKFHKLIDTILLTKYIRSLQNFQISEFIKRKYWTEIWNSYQYLIHWIWIMGRHNIYISGINIGRKAEGPFIQNIGTISSDRVSHGRYKSLKWEYIKDYNIPICDKVIDSFPEIGEASFTVENSTIKTLSHIKRINYLKLKDSTITSMWIVESIWCLIIENSIILDIWNLSRIEQLSDHWNSNPDLRKLVDGYSGEEELDDEDDELRDEE